MEKCKVKLLKVLKLNGIGFMGRLVDIIDTSEDVRIMAIFSGDSPQTWFDKFWNIILVKKALDQTG